MTGGAFAGAGSLPRAFMRSVNRSRADRRGFNTLRDSGDLLLQSSGTTALPKMRGEAGDRLTRYRPRWRGDSIHADRSGVVTVPLTHSYGLEHGLLAPSGLGAAFTCAGAGPFGNGPRWPATAHCSERAGGLSRCCAGPMGWVDDPKLRWRTRRVALPKSCSMIQGKVRVAVTQLYGRRRLARGVQCAVGRGFDSASVGRGCAAYQFDPGLAGRHVTATSGSEGQVAIRRGRCSAGTRCRSAALTGFSDRRSGLCRRIGPTVITGRIKLLIDIGGMKVNPLEVEAVLQGDTRAWRRAWWCRCAERDGLPAEGGGDAGRSRAPPRRAELRELARKHLAAYKCAGF